MAGSPGPAPKTRDAPQAASRQRTSVGQGRPLVGRETGQPLHRLQSAIGNQAMASLAAAQRQAWVAARGPARPLDPAARQDMEGRFGEDLGSVRVRTDPAACDGVDANAYAVGENIVFNAGRYAPQRQAGRALLAHELAHVIQQRRGAGGMAPSGLEREAHGAARAAAFGEGPIPVTGRAPVGIARDGKVAAPAPLVDLVELALEGTTTAYVDGIPVLRFPTVNAAKVNRMIGMTTEQPDTIFINVVTTADSGARLDQAGLDQLSSRFKIVANFETRGTFAGERDGGIGPSLGPTIPLAPASKPIKPAAKARPAPLKTLPVAAKIEEPQAPIVAQAQPVAADPAPPQPKASPPLDLTDRVATIRKNLKDWTFNVSWKQDIVNAFKDLSPDDFLRLQNELTEGEMNSVFDQLPSFFSTLIGTYGPVVKGRDKLNENRVDFIEKIRNWGSANDTFYRWEFASMSLDDMHVVIAKLAQDKRLHETLLTVPGLADNLQARGIAPVELEEEATGTLQGIGRGLGHLWDGAWSSTVFADGPGFEYSYLPKNYQELYVDNLSQDFVQSLTPLNVVRGAASNITLGMSDVPFGVYDASRLTVAAAQDLWNGKTGAAAEKLTPVVAMILAALIGRRIGRSGVRPGAALALEESKALALAPAEGAVLADSKSLPGGGGAPEWDVRKVGQTAEGADRYIGRHANGELVELIVDPKKQTMHATRLATGEVVNFDNGQFSRGSPPQLTAGEGVTLPQSPQSPLSPQPLSPPSLALPAPPTTPLQLPWPAAPLALPAKVAPLTLGEAAIAKAAVPAVTPPRSGSRPAGQVPLGLLPPGPQLKGLLPPGPQPIGLLPPGPQPFGLLPPGEPPSSLTLAPDARAIPGAPGVVTGGSSQALGKNLLETYGLARRQKFSGWQPHHLIPTEAASHPVILKIGMNLDHPTNGIMLPEPGVGWPGRLPTHQGYHSLFSNVALGELDKIDVNLSIPELQLKVFGVQWRLRLAVEAGLPLYYSKGGTELDWQRSLLLPVPR